MTAAMAVGTIMPPTSRGSCPQRWHRRATTRVPTTTATASSRPYMCSGMGPMSTVPLDGLGMNAGTANGMGGDGRALNKSGGFVDTGAVIARRHVRATLGVAALLVSGACGRTSCGPNGGGSPPPGASTGDQNGPLNGCPVFPANNPWNANVSTLPLRSNSSVIVQQVLADGPGFLHADFGGGGAYGIPYVTVPATEPQVPVNFTEYPNESDPGPYAIPLGAPVEGGGVGDAHAIGVDRDNCRLYELYHASPQNGSWNAGSGATWDLRSNAMRPAGWTSADAAGLPIFHSFARFVEVTSRAIILAL